MDLKQLFSDTEDMDRRYQRIIKHYETEPVMIAGMVALVHGMLPSEKRKSMEATAYDISRTLLAFLVWLEFGPRRAKALVPLLSELIKNTEAVVLSAADAQIDASENGARTVITHDADAGHACDVALGADVLKFQIRDPADEIDHAVLARYFKKVCFDLPNEMDLSVNDIVHHLVMVLRHIVLHSSPDRHEAAKLLATAGEWMAGHAEHMTADHPAGNGGGGKVH